MKTKAFISLISCVACLSACGDNSDHINNIEPPKVGGLITKSGEEFAVVVRYRDGTVKRAPAELIKKNDPKGKGSVDTIYTFNVDGCGYLDFVKPPFSGAVLMPDDADSAHQEPNCIISGAVENKWNIDA